MEKQTLLSEIKDKLTEMNIPAEKSEKYLTIFEEILKEKTPDELMDAINSVGGIGEIIKSVYTPDDEISGVDEQKDEVIPEPSDNTAEAEQLSTAAVSIGVQDKDEWKPLDISKSPEFDRHVREAEAITTELEKTTVNDIPIAKRNEEIYHSDLSDYDFEKLFAQKTTRPELWINNIKSKLNPESYKYSLPIAILAFLLIFGVVAFLYVAVIASVVFLGVSYVLLLIGGLLFALIPIGYGVFMSSKGSPVGLLEIGIGITVIGVVMLSCILIYNYIKRLVPFLFEQLKSLFRYCVKLTKLYFKPIKQGGKI